VRHSLADHGGYQAQAKYDRVPHRQARLDAAYGETSLRLLPAMGRWDSQFGAEGVLVEGVRHCARTHLVDVSLIRRHDVHTEVVHYYSHMDRALQPQVAVSKGHRFLQCRDDIKRGVVIVVQGKAPQEVTIGVRSRQQIQTSLAGLQHGIRAERTAGLGGYGWQVGLAVDRQSEIAGGRVDHVYACLQPIALDVDPGLALERRARLLASIADAYQGRNRPVGKVRPAGGDRSAQ